jgi:branched-chain amino acid transport system substrate-binding protein
MQRMILLAAALVFSTPVQAQDPIRIGMINVTSGQFADAGIQLDNGAKTYMQMHGDTIAGRKIEIIRRDAGGAAPDVAKRLAQELIVRDRVDLLTGFLLTPNTLAVADVSAEAKKFMVVMNAGTSIITTKSPYIVRTSVTSAQAIEPFGTWAAKRGIKQAYTMVADYGPGHDAEMAFIRAFKEAGGEIVGSVRYPVVNADFSVFVRRAKDSNAEAIFYFVPGGAQPAALGKAFLERGIDPQKTKLLGTGDATSEAALKSLGDAAIGVLSAWNYDYKLDSPLNPAFVRAFNDMHKRNPDVFSIGAYDGMHVIYETLKKTGGKTDGDALIAAAKGLSWQSPRGPMSIDPDTRDAIQTIYIREVRKVGGEVINMAIDRIENVKDPIKARMK